MSKLLIVSLRASSKNRALTAELLPYILYLATEGVGTAMARSCYGRQDSNLRPRAPKAIDRNYFCPIKFMDLGEG